MEDTESIASLASDSSRVPGHVHVEKKMRKMRPSQFVHLSADYMSKGSLESALQIMQFAETKGYGNNILILLHTWCLLRALGDDYNAGLCFDRACATIASAERSYLDNLTTVFEGSQLQVFAAYLVCIVHILKKEKSNFTKVNPHQEHSMAEAMLIEAMYLRHGKEPALEDAVHWFYRDKTWLDVAAALRETDFILLAEDAYWEAFVRNHHQNEPLIQVIEIKAESNRADTAMEFMLRALKIGRFNWFLRQYISALEGEKRTEEIEHILDGFYDEDRAAIKIQSVARMRKHLTRFEIKKGELRKKKAEYNARLQKAAFMGKLTVQKNAHRIYLIWWKKARDSREHKLYYLKRLKKYIQNYMVWLRYYRSNTRRSKLALKYISATQVNYDFTRLHYLKVWLHTLRMVVLTRAADTINFTLKTHRRNDTLEWHLKTTSRIALKRKAKVLRSLMAHWSKKYETKVRIRAVAVIRLVIRSVIRKYLVKTKAARVEAAAVAVKEMIYSNKHQLMKRRWVKWRKLFKRSRKIWAFSALATHIPLVLRRRQSRVRLLLIRRYVEQYKATEGKHLYLNKHSVYYFWCIARAVYRIQRMIRIKIARINLHRRAELIAAVADKYKATKEACRNSHWVRWIQFVVMWKETKEKASSAITIFWQRVHYSRKAVKARKHMKGSRVLAGSINRMLLRRTIKRISRSVEMIKKAAALNKMYAALRIYYLRVAMNLFKEFDAYHVQVRKVIHVTVHKKLSRIFYPGVHLSVHVSPVAIVPILGSCTDSNDMYHNQSPAFRVYVPFDRSRGGDTPFMLTCKEAGCDCGLNDTALEWEHYVKPRVFAMGSLDKYSLLKAFQILMASYRIRVRRLRSLSFLLAEGCSAYVLRQTALRCASAHTLQRSWRCVKARMQLTELIRRARRLHELSRKLTALKPKRRKLFNRIRRGTFLRIAARVRLQTWVRMMLQSNTIVNKKISFSRLVNLEAFVHFKMKTNITRIIMRHMIFNYGVRSSQMMLHPTVYPGPFKTTVLAESPLDLLAPTISRSKGSINKDSRCGNTKFSASLANLRTNNHGDVLEYGERDSVLHSRSQRSLKTTSGLAKKGSVAIPGVLKSFSSEVFHSHLFNLKKSNMVILDNSKPMIQDDEIAYLASVADVFFCETGSLAGNHALKILIENFRGTKLVVFGGKIDLPVSRDLAFSLSARIDQDDESHLNNFFKLHLSAAPMKFEAVERLARSIASSTCWLTELSVDISSVGCLGIVTILSSLRVNTSVKVMIVHFDKHFPNQWYIEKSFRYLALNTTLQGLYLYGMLLERDTCLGLLAAVTDGLPSLTSLEFEYEEEKPEATDLFREVIVKRDLAMKVAIHAPSSASLASLRPAP